MKWDFFCDFQTSTYLLCIPWEYLSVIILKQDIYFGQDLERENEQNYIKQEWKHFSDHRSKLPHSNTATSVSKTTSSPAKLDFCPAFLFFLWRRDRERPLHGVWKSQKKSHSTFTFTFWVDKKVHWKCSIWRVFKNVKLAIKQCYQTGQFQ